MAALRILMTVHLAFGPRTLMALAPPTVRACPHAYTSDRLSFRTRVRQRARVCARVSVRVRVPVRA